MYKYINLIQISYIYIFYLGNQPKTVSLQEKVMKGYINNFQLTADNLSFGIDFVLRSIITTQILLLHNTESNKH